MELLEIKDFFTVEIVERLNRFVVLVKKGNRLLKAHNTNTGRLKDFLQRGKKAFCLSKKGGKTDCRLFAVEDTFGFSLIDTALQMAAFERAYRKGLLNWLYPTEWKMVRKNAPLGEHSLIDYLFEHKSGRKLYLEIKSAAMRSEENFGMYPDCPTQRGRKHIKELLKNPSQSGILFICALPKVAGFKPNCEGDREICRLLKEAKRRGLPIRAMGISFSPKRGAVILERDNLPVEI